MTKENKAKLQAWKLAEQAKAKEHETIKKAIRRHNGTPHAFALWGKRMSILRAIHKEIQPLLDAKHIAEDSIYRARDSKFIASTMF